LLNGRRLVAAPFAGPEGSDYVDLNQLPITLIDRIETSRGLAAGLYGDGAIGGVVNFITHRDYEGIEVDVGGQVTDKFDQHEEDITLTVGVGSEKTGMNAMVSYFTRQPLAAGDRDWIKDREDRTQSLTNSPASYQPLVAFEEYPYPDPFCGIATDAGHASGLELRVPLFGRPVTRDGRNVLGDPDLLPTDRYRERYGNNDVTRGDGDGLLEAYETSTYCSGNFTSVQDLVLKDERIQMYTTLWHELSAHTEAFGELGYYRSDNQNRIAPSFPVTRIAPDPARDERIVVEPDHADQPVQYPGFGTTDELGPARAPNIEFLVGRVVGLHAGSNLNTRRVDVLRGVLGLRGDLEAAGSGTVIETWDWELAGVYSASNATTRVPDILLDQLSQALASCPRTVVDGDVSSATYGMQIPSTIKQRQEAGCFNPFYNSVTNNAAIDPLGLSSASPANDRGFIATDSEKSSERAGFGRQDGGYICDPNDPDSPMCPDEFDPDGDGSYELAGTPNTQQVIDRMTGEHVTEERRTLGTIDGVLRGDVLHFDGGGLSFGVGGQYRRETLRIDYDAAFNRRLYAFVFGAPDVPPVARNVGAAFAELRLQLLDGLVELQPAARVEYFDDVGTGANALVGLALRPFASMAAPPKALEWLLARAHVGHGHRAPSLLQLHGSYTEFQSVEFADRLRFIPQQVSGNPDLDFEQSTTLSGGLQWDYAGIHVAADFWMTQTDDVIGSDNLQTLLRDCEAQYVAESKDCPEVVLLTGGRQLNHVEGMFDNLAEVDTNGIDGGVSYTLDTKRRGLGELGTFVLGVQGTFLNQYLIKSPRALREFYRADGGTPELVDGKRDYSELSAEYDAAGFRNLENFAPPLPKLRFSVPVSWAYEGHTLGVTMRYTGEYNDDSELTIEKYGLAPPGVSLADLSSLEGERIAAWVVFDAGYGFSFGAEGWRASLRVGVINLLDEPPPEAEGPLGYDVGIHDPRGRLVYVRATGEF
ncbi:MAG TPA: TonB-dependent receptor, partial [Polyangiales bacterium]|nr:TonB-dependent receptor [Polyangiales bacterium]